MDVGAVLITIFSAMTPIGEVRLAVPLAMHTYDMVWYQALVWGLLGNLVPVPLLLWALEPLSRLLVATPNPVGRVLMWRAAKLRESQSRSFQRWGALALFLFVAIPLPLTGAWSGCLLAWAMGIPFRKALLANALGVLGAAIIVTALTQLSVNFPFVGH